MEEKVVYTVNNTGPELCPGYKDNPEECLRIRNLDNDDILMYHYHCLFIYVFSMIMFLAVVLAFYGIKGMCKDLNRCCQRRHPPVRAQGNDVEDISVNNNLSVISNNDNNRTTRVSVITEDNARIGNNLFGDISLEVPEEDSSSIALDRILERETQNFPISCKTRLPLTALPKIHSFCSKFAPTQKDYEERVLFSQLMMPGEEVGHTPHWSSFPLHFTSVLETGMCLRNETPSELHEDYTPSTDGSNSQPESQQDSDIEIYI